MIMAKRHKFTCSLHLHFKRAFRDEKSVRAFSAEFRKYLQAEMEKVAGIKFSSEESMIAVSTKDREILFSLAKNFMDILMKGVDSVKDLRVLDTVFNKTFGFVNVSKPSVKSLRVNFSKEHQLNRNPMDVFLNRASLAEFNSRSKKSFILAGVAFGERGRDKDTLAMFSYSPYDESTILNVAEIRSDVQGPPWDILTRSSDSVDDSKQKILSALGVRER
jgi:hypothetical protein